MNKKKRKTESTDKYYPEHRRISIYVPFDTLKKLKTCIIDKNKTQQEWILEVIENALSDKKSILKNQNVELAPGQRAVVVVIDNVDDQKKAALNSAIGLMQGVKTVVDVPLNGEG
jgi:hypothetical protein